MKMIYISHKYGGDKQNKDLIEIITGELIKHYPDYCFVSPVHCFGYLYNDVDYDKGMEYCLALLGLCDEMWICSDYSKGVLIEQEYCKCHNIPIRQLTQDNET